MDRKLYVGNLPFSADEAEIKELFSQAGTVESVTLIKDRVSGRAKGFGFVEMSNQAGAKEAIRLFNAYEFGGRAMRVSVARPQAKRSGSQHRGGRSGGDRSSGLPPGRGGRPGGGYKKGGGAQKSGFRNPSVNRRDRSK